MGKSNKKKYEEFVPNENVDIEGFVERYQNVLASVIIIVTLLIGMLLFNFRVDEGGDDSTYICRAVDFLESGFYPNYQGPLYPIFLSLVIMLFGTSVGMLKFASLALILVSQYLFFRVLRDKVNVRLVLSVMALLSLSSWYMFFASMTYSEPLFIVVEYLFFGAMLRYENGVAASRVREFVGALPSGLFVVLSFLVRTVGAGLGIAGVLYLCLRKKYAKALMFVASMVLFMLVWTGVRTVVWGSVKQDTSQIKSLTQVDAYDASEGQETLKGYVVRFWGNSKLYMSKHLMRYLGFKNIEDRETSGMTVVIVYGIFLYGMYVSFKRNRSVFLLSVVTMVMLGITFVVLQLIWDQQRLIAPYLAGLLLVLLYGVHHLSKLLLKKRAHYIPLVLVIMCCIMSFSQSANKMDAKTLRKNLTGDELYGYTPDWYNYLKMCKESVKVLPEGSYIACRKPNMARIYAGGKKFYGIYNVPSEDPDELIEDLRKHGVTHVIVASLRMDPLFKNGNLINTIHRYMSFIHMKYPDAFKYMGRCGDDENEPSYLFEVDYEYVDGMKSKLAEGGLQ